MFFKYRSLFFLLVCEWISTNYTTAQISVGVIGGYTNNCMNTDMANLAYTRQVNLGGYSFGILYKKTLSKVFALQAEFQLVQKNYSFERNGSYKGIFEDFYNTYLQLPLRGQLDILRRKKISIALNAGVFGAYWVFTKVNGVAPNVFNTTNQVDATGEDIQNFYLTKYSEVYRFNSKKDNRFEFGLHTGVTLQYDANEKNGFFMEYIYYHSLSDTQKKYMVNQVSKVNQTSLVSVGFLMKFNSKK
ncbi:MAG TPA: outer membrane beta-barrel protein [Bacteroidales bacterium]